MNEKGFTLMELLIAVAIIGILALGASTAYIGVLKKAARSEAYSNLESLRLLQEQFFAENGAYPVDRGAAGNTFAIRDANATDIQNDLRGFRPGNGAIFSYRIIQNRALVPPVAAPYDNTMTADTTTLIPAYPCFIAIATGIAGTRVCPNAANCDMFVIDCNNIRNF